MLHMQASKLHRQALVLHMQALVLHMPVLHCHSFGEQQLFQGLKVLIERALGL